MKFQINESSRYPGHEQIKEQIRIAISLGHIGPGYALPSIRDLERDLEVGRTVVHRAYRELQQSGILTLQPRKGVVVSRKIVLPTSNHQARRCELLANRVVREAKRIGVLGSSFAEFLYHRVQIREQRRPPIAFVMSIKTEALECAEQIGRAWGTNVAAVSLDEFKRLKRSEISFRWVLMPFYEYEWVARMAKRLKVEVAPIVLKFSAAFIAELALALKARKALIILADEDFERHGQQLIGELISRIEPDRAQRLVTRPLSEVKNIEAAARSGKYSRVYIGDRLWDSLDPRIKELPKLGHPRVEIDNNSLQQAKVKLGLLV